MRNIAVAFLLIVAALAVTKTQSGSDAVRDGIRKAGSKCSVSPHRPQKQGGRVVATGEVLCDRPGPQQLTLTVQLQRSPDGKQWTTVASQAYTSAGADTTSERPASARRHTAGVACANATWRTAVQWSAQDQSGTTKGSRTSEPRKNVC
ncbi:hypothetical protein [Dactylosporangium sp. CA-139066]|uniref:hypothetical protein n=1 Tax=Dactylosporangium sp. CA-139066 TaxID=3239930 RepID=UPI003D8F2C57